MAFYAEGMDQLMRPGLGRGAVLDDGESAPDVRTPNRIAAVVEACADLFHDHKCRQLSAQQSLTLIDVGRAVLMRICAGFGAVAEYVEGGTAGYVSGTIGSCDDRIGTRNLRAHLSFGEHRGLTLRMDEQDANRMLVPGLADKGVRSFTYGTVGFSGDGRRSVAADPGQEQARKDYQ